MSVLYTGSVIEAFCCCCRYMTLLCSRVDILYCSLQWVNKRYESVTQSIVHIVMDGVDSGSDAGGDRAEESADCPSYMVSDFKTMLIVEANQSVKVNGSEIVWNLFFHIHELYRVYEGFSLCVIKFAVQQYMEKSFLREITFAHWIIYYCLVCEICLKICVA